MRGIEVYRDFVLQSRIFTFQLTAHIHPSSRFYRDGERIGLFEGDPKRDKERLGTQGRR